MAKHIFYDNSLVVNAVDLSDHVEDISLVATTNKQMASAMGELNDYNMPGTLALSDITATFYQDYASAKVYATINAAWAARTTFNIVMKPTSGAASATNPQWTVPVFVSSMPVMSGKRGDRHMAPVTFTVAGAHSISAP
ncbi:hypothetical protein UFOVP1236_40 [uncultured Caudovirales phage]|uniref:Uncharacterized protein n=1 Tax=uncultured Caudovirales phage TaxID=2100421 RepID=A0A6J5RFS5_9CAUD|nr:hypothetical protein UFOVP1236_40 [uncultured Caudovirales phage]